MITALLLGRGGSKGVPGKNNMNILGRPLMEYPIIAAKNSKYIECVFLSTEDEAIKTIGREHRLEIIDRPKELSTDEALVEDVIVHGYQEMSKRVNCIINTRLFVRSG
jgi:CMP-N-acetylneuraminic acid synthetase